MGRKIILIVVVLLGCQFVALISLTVVRCFVESRQIPSTSMQPTIIPGDRVLFEKVSKWSGHQVERGAIVCLVPPISKPGAPAPGGFDLMRGMGRLTGLPIFPNEIVYIKRIIAIAGDQVRIEPDVGVYINGKLVPEPYVSAPASYEVSAMSEICGQGPYGNWLKPYPNDNEPVVVPKGMIFALGDDRNKSDDSHIWGFASEDAIIGRAWCLVSPRYLYVHKAYWRRPVLSFFTAD
ncbi:signal peptidase I [soil metagenome]